MVLVLSASAHSLMACRACAAIAAALRPVASGAQLSHIPCLVGVVITRGQEVSARDAGRRRGPRTSPAGRAASTLLLGHRDVGCRTAVRRPAAGATQGGRSRSRRIAVFAGIAWSVLGWRSGSRDWPGPALPEGRRGSSTCCRSHGCAGPVCYRGTPGAVRRRSLPRHARSAAKVRIGTRGDLGVIASFAVSWEAGGPGRGGTVCSSAPLGALPVVSASESARRA